jgi:hypothetical protein
MESTSQSVDAKITVAEVANIFRRILSDDNAPVKGMVDSGVISEFVKMLTCNDKPEVQFEAVGIFVKIAEANLSKAVVDYGAVPNLVALLSSPYSKICVLSTWCLGKFAHDSPTLRDVIIAEGALQPLIQNILSPATPLLFDDRVCALWGLCPRKPGPELGLIMPAIPDSSYCATLSSNNEDSRVIARCLWALSYISDGQDYNRMKAVVNSEVVPKLIDLLSSDYDQSSIATLRTVGNIVYNEMLNTLKQS